MNNNDKIDSSKLDQSLNDNDVNGLIKQEYKKRIEYYKKSSKILSLIVIVVAILIMVGWLFNIPLLRGDISQFYATKFNTALTFVLAGGALYLANIYSKKYSLMLISKILALAVLFIGIITFLQYISGVNLGLDQLLFTQPFRDPVETITGRTKFLSSLIFIIYGFALFLLTNSKRNSLFQMLALIGGFIAFFGFTGAVYGVKIIHVGDWVVQMALFTSIIHILLSIGILMYKPDQGLMEIITSTKSGGIISRQLLGNLIIIIFVIGFLRVMGENTGLYGTKTGTVAIVVFSSIIIISLVLLSANKLNILDEKRDEAIKRIKKLEKFYENIIESVNEGIFVTDKNDKVIYYNKAFKRTTGMMDFDLMGIDILNEIPHENVDEFLQYFEEAKKTLKPVYFESIPILTTPTTRFFTGWILPEVENESFNGALCTIIDDTDRRNASKQIENSLLEKEMLLGEIHHRVKNNLQIISSLLNLQSVHIKDPEDKDLFTESQNRVKSMAIIHEKLYQSKNFSRINFKDYIISLVKDIMGTYMIDPNQIRFEINAHNIELNLETAIPCGLILNELITNAIKHAFPQELKGKISINFEEDNGTYILTVSDNGVGFPKDLDLESAKTLGLELVRNLVNQLEGDIKLDSNHGTYFKISFQEIEYKKRI